MTDEHPGQSDSTPGGRPAENAAQGTPAADAADSARGRGRWVIAAAAALGVALFAVPFLQGPEVPSDHTAAGGRAAAGESKCSSEHGTANLDFTLKDIEGADVRLADYKGKVILLNFWATWCGPCKVEIPEFVEAYTEHRDKGFVILGVLSQDDPPADDLRAFTTAYKMNYPVLRENPELDEAFGPLYAIPTSFIIDRQGSICTKHMGPVSKEMLEREIKALL